MHEPFCNNKFKRQNITVGPGHRVALISKWFFHVLPAAAGIYVFELVVRLKRLGRDFFSCESPDIVPWMIFSGVCLNCHVFEDKGFDHIKC